MREVGVQLDILKAELERLFELEQLRELGEKVLGLDVREDSEVTTKGAFVSALVKRCIATDSLVALCDVVLSSREGVSSELSELQARGLAPGEPLLPADTLGPYLIEERLGEGPSSTVYAGRSDGTPVRIKLLRPLPGTGQANVQRFFAVQRQLADSTDPSLPKLIFAGQLQQRTLLVHELFEAQPLRESMSTGRPTKLRKLWPTLRSVLRALAAVHAKNLAHGSLKPENILVAVGAGSEDTVLLLDAGAHFLHRLVGADLQSAVLLGAASLKYAAPEQLRGELPTPRTDVYAFGALLYELLSGRPAFAGTGLDLLISRLHTDPEPLSFVTPRRWVTSELDEIVMQLLDRDPAKRPADAEAALDVLEVIAAHSVRLDSYFPPREFEQRVTRLLEHPQDEEVAAVLEASIDQGAMPSKVAQAFRAAADQLDDRQENRIARRRLLIRAGAIYESAGNDLAAAAQAYRLLLRVDPQDEPARASLERVYRHQGRYEELIELLLEQAESAESPAVRGRAFSKVGGLFHTKLGDPEQALVALTQAFCYQPRDTSLQGQIERLAAAQLDRWEEVLTTCAEHVSEDLPADQLPPLLAQMGHWYEKKLARPDLALSCYQRIVALDPADDLALARMAEIYRRAQQWRELGAVLLRRADASVVPALARDLRTAAARILQQRLDDERAATQLYEHVFDEEPSHRGAAEALAQIHEQAGDGEALARVLDQCAEASTGEYSHTLRCRLAGLYVGQLDDPAVAESHYARVLEQNPAHLEALRGLERLYEQTGKHAKLVTNLEQQVSVAVTPHQKTELLERIAKLYETEFLEPDKAAEALERVVELAPDHADASARVVGHYTARARWPKLARFYQRRAEVLQGCGRIEALLALGELASQQLGDNAQAMLAYQGVLAVEPGHRLALKAIARIQSVIGDEEHALRTIEQLAEEAGSPTSQVLHLVNAAQILERRGDLEGVIDLCKRALNADPDDTAALDMLRSAYVKQGDVEAAIELTERELARVEGSSTKARVCVELAELFRGCLHDAARAEAMLSRAIEFDPTHLQARSLLANIAYEGGRYDDALHHFEFVTRHLSRLDLADAVNAVGRYLDSLGRTGAIERALAAVDGFLERLPDEYRVLRRIGEFLVQHASPERTLAFTTDLLRRFGARVNAQQRAELLCWVGDAARCSGRLDAAIGALEEAVVLDPQCVSALQILTAVYRDQGKWQQAAQVMRRQLGLVSGDAHVGVLLALGELQAGKLDDPEGAANSYLAALGEKPGDRRLLLKLMDLYGATRDWAKLVNVIINLAGFTADAGQKAKYLQTAARVAERELGDADRAAWLLEKALKVDPAADEIVHHVLRLQQGFGDTEGAQRLLEQQVRAASEAQDRDRALHYAELLADVHLAELRVDDAVTVYEAVQSLDPENARLQELLSDLYASDPARYFQRAVANQQRILDQDPYRPEAYRVLRQVYIGAKRPDAVWCVTQVLAVLHRATPKEELFFKRYRRADGLVPGAALSDEDWSTLVNHGDLDPNLTSIFSLIQPTVLAGRATSLEELGLSQSDAILPEQHPYGLTRALQRAALMLRVPVPLLLHDPASPRGISLPPTEPRCLVLGTAGLARNVSSRRAAFVAASHLASLKPGWFVRYVIPTAVALRAWLLAAIKLVSPRIPVAPELEGAVDRAHAALSKQVTGPVLDRLTQPVYRLLQHSAQVDVTRWMAAVDYTTDRIGLIASDDLQTALEVLEASQRVDSGFAASDRARELLRYAVSREYIELRDRLRIGIGWRELEVEEVSLDELLEPEPRSGSR